MVLNGLQRPGKTERVKGEGENRKENVCDALETKIVNLKRLSFEYLRERSPGHSIWLGEILWRESIWLSIGDCQWLRTAKENNEC